MLFELFEILLRIQIKKESQKNKETHNILYIKISKFWAAKSTVLTKNRLKYDVYLMGLWLLLGMRI